MSAGGFTTERMADGLWRIVDALEYHAYLIVGTERALLVDSCGGFGDLRACVERLTNLPLQVALTHGHYDHVAGSYWFEEVYLSDAEGDIWEVAEDHARYAYENAIAKNDYPDDVAFAPRDGARPRMLPVAEGDRFDLGGRTVSVVSLPGHTVGSVGYLLEEERILLTGDAVTPIMCLCFENSASLEVWRDTLARMAKLPFDHFYTGHHDHAFTKEDLPSFDAVAAMVPNDRGMEWHHMIYPEMRGIFHLMPTSTSDSESPDFRALIEPWHELPPRKRRARGAS